MHAGRAHLPCHRTKVDAWSHDSGVTQAALGGGMHTPLRQQLLQQALSIIELARPLVEAIARRDRDLASQLRRALSSTALNLAEGFGTRAGNARLRFETALGSLYEAQAALRVAAAWGFVQKQRAAAVVQLDRLGGRVFGLSRH